jgi:hypothetical protein
MYHVRQDHIETSVSKQLHNLNRQSTVTRANEQRACPEGTQQAEIVDSVCTMESVCSVCVRVHELHSGVLRSSGMVSSSGQHQHVGSRPPGTGILLDDV